jgi:hypothetical protein
MKSAIDILKQIKLSLLAVLNLLKNKAASIVGLIALAWTYKNLPETSAFIALVYVILLINLIMVAAPIMRWFVFNEASRYAESGRLEKDLESNFLIHSNYAHYKFATAICYACVTVCVGALAFI